MKSVRVIHGSTRFEFAETDLPRLRAGAVKVRILAAFLPPYFEHLPSGAWMTPPRPFTPGQCAIGVVEELGDGVEGFAPGQRVYCDMYVQGQGPVADQGFIGCFAIHPEGQHHLATWPDGTFADYFVGPEHCLTAIPDTVQTAPEVLCRLGWFATALEGFRRGGFRPGMTVAIHGASGLLGASAALLACAIGAGEVRLIGRRADHLAELARLDPRIRVEAAGDATPLDLILDCAGGDAAATTSALVTRLKRYGSTVFVGALSAPVAVDTSRLMRNSTSLVGSFWFSHETAADVLALVGSGALNLGAVRATTFALDQIGDAMKHSVAMSGGLTHVALKP